MWAVLFEVTPKADRWDAYLAHAAALRPALLQIDGFLDNRRFASRSRPGTLLSLSYWRDEAALIDWRSHGHHRSVQAAGRAEVFEAYRLRVGEATDRRPPGARFVSAIETPTATVPEGVEAWDIFDGITEPGTSAMLLTWRDGAAMDAWGEIGGTRRTDLAIARDYGLHDRAEAPVP